MDKRLAKWHGAAFLACASLAIFRFEPIALAVQSQPDASIANRYESLIKTQVDRAKSDLERTEKLAEDGALPKAKVAEAKLRLADVEDEATLARTLYGPKNAEELSAEEAGEMVAAAQRRVERARVRAEERENLLSSGAIARVDLQAAEDDLADRKRVLQLAEDRIQLIKELKAMAEAERQLVRPPQGANGLKESMIRYDGNGAFALGDLTTIEKQFEKKFHHELPVSALGQTLMHQSLGLDHRNRVDVAISPDQPEGVWLRALLERLHVPYLAFRTAVAGAATAPHIHIGVGSTRLKLEGSP